MDTKQAILKELVVSYFRQRLDTEIKAVTPALYDVLLKSEVAQTDFGGRQQLRLVFDAEQAYEHPEGELIVPGHPFLEVMANDLERDGNTDPRLSELHALPNILAPTGETRVPQLAFTGSQFEVSAGISYHAYLVLTYRVSYDTEERSEDIVRLCYDAETGLQRHDLISQIASLMQRDGAPPVQNIHPLQGLASILQQGRQEILARIEPDLFTIDRQINERLNSEKKRLSDYYEGLSGQQAFPNLTNQDQNQAMLAKDVEEIERKLSCRVRVELLSVMRLWWPLIDYDLTVSRNRGQFKISGIRYDAARRTTSYQTCPKCGNSDRFGICAAGQHTICTSQCRQELAHCETCQDSFCPEHGGPCQHCQKQTCQAERQRCTYGHHSQNDFFCPDCLVASYESKPLCLDCREHCVHCGRSFPHERMASCRVGGERICYDHSLTPDGLRCPECQQLTCREHGRELAAGDLACRDHALAATCCDRVFGLSALVLCCNDPQEALCPEHRSQCQGCGQAVCEHHRASLVGRPNKYVCQGCSQECLICGTKKHYLAADLATCSVCHIPMCTTHRALCVICGATVCAMHLQKDVAGRVLCPEHARTSTCCKRVFAVTELQPCRSDAHELLCPDHRNVCQGCGGTTCVAHRSPLHNHRGQYTCQTCRCTCSLCEPSTAYLAADLGTCQTCGKAVCGVHRQHCLVGRELVCGIDVAWTAQREPLCKKHAGACVQCDAAGKPQVHRTDQLSTCVVCNHAVCGSHRSSCPVCNSTVMCTAHLHIQPHCESCGRAACETDGCGVATNACQRCGVAYCRLCVTSGGVCSTCAALGQVAINESWLKFLRSVGEIAARNPQSYGANTAKLLSSMAESPDQLILRDAKNQSYRVVVARFAPKWYQIWREDQQLRITIKLVDNTVKRIELEVSGS